MKFTTGVSGSLFIGLLASLSALAAPPQQQLVQVNMTGMGIQGTLVYSLVVEQNEAGIIQKVRLYGVGHEGDPAWDHALDVSVLKTSSPPALMNSHGMDTIWVSLDPSFDPNTGGFAKVKYVNSPITRGTSILQTKIVKNTKDGQWDTYAVETDKLGNETSYVFRQLDATVKWNKINLDPVQ